MKSAILSLIAPMLLSGMGATFSPVKSALSAGVADPGAALGTLQNLASAEGANLNALAPTLVSEGCQLALATISKIEEFAAAEIAKILTPAVAPASPPVAEAEKAAPELSPTA